jgi:hypothetical protein
MNEHNIFVNPVLYENSRAMLNKWIDQPIPSFDNFSDYLPFRENNSVLFQSYYCQKRQRKGALNLFITVIAADYALIMGGYKLVVFIASWIEKRRQEGIHPIGSAHLTCGSKLLRGVLSTSPFRRSRGGGSTTGRRVRSGGRTERRTRRGF